MREEGSEKVRGKMPGMLLEGSYMLSNGIFKFSEVFSAF